MLSLGHSWKSSVSLLVVKLVLMSFVGDIKLQNVSWHKLRNVGYNSEGRTESSLN